LPRASLLLDPCIYVAPFYRVIYSFYSWWTVGRSLHSTFSFATHHPQIPTISVIGLQEAYPIFTIAEPIDMAGDASSEARELNLVAKVEMRFALADSDSKLQTLLSTYLAPLLLKLASEHAAVRNKVITVCH